MLFCVIAAIGVLALSGFTDGETAVGLWGVAFTAVGSFGLVAMLRSRVWVDDEILRSRSVLGFGSPIRLDRLTHASLSELGQGGGWRLCLIDADGSTVSLDGLNLQLTQLYAVLAEHINHDDPHANALLHRRMDKHRPASAFGSG